LTTGTNTAHCTGTNNKKTKFALRKVEDFTWPENQMWLGLSKTNPRTTRSGGLHEWMVISGNLCQGSDVQTIVWR
jgi:hypothetical protein